MRIAVRKPIDVCYDRNEPARRFTEVQKSKIFTPVSNFACQDRPLVKLVNFEQFSH